MAFRELLRESIADCLQRENPLDRPEYTEPEVQALRAVYSGEATPRQQRMLCEWLMRASGKDDEPFRPDNQDLTAYACGKRSIGTTFVWMLKVAPSKTDPDKIAVRHIEDDPNARPDNR